MFNLTHVRYRSLFKFGFGFTFNSLCTYLLADFVLFLFELTGGKERVIVLSNILLFGASCCSLPIIVFPLFHPLSPFVSSDFNNGAWVTRDKSQISRYFRINLEYSKA